MSADNEASAAEPGGGLLQIECTVTGAYADDAEALLWAFGALGITVLPAGDSAVVEPDPGTTPAFAQSRLCALFAADVPAEQLRAMLERQPGVDVATLRAIADADWVAAWRQHARPLRFGRLHVLPTDAEPPTAADAVIVRLDAGLAFGTGTHPSTAACLAWLAQAPVAGRSVLDYGCGSGILSLAARALGASRIVAVDHDVQARTATAANARVNEAPGADATIEVLSPDTLPANLQADVVLANIVSGVLIELAPRLSASVAPGGYLVLAGILGWQVDAVCAAYPAFTFTIAADGDWAALAGTRR